LSEALKIAKVGYWEYEFAADEFIFNDQYYSLHKITAEEAGGYRMSSTDFAHRYLHPEDAPIVGQQTQLAFESADPNYRALVEARLLTGEGAVFWVETRITVVKDAEGRTIKLVGVNQDITERKLAEDGLRQSEEERRTLESQLHQAQKIESIGQLAGGVAHDFNNMLGVILGHAELGIIKSTPSGKCFSDLEAIRDAANRSADLTRQLLTFARKQAISPVSLNLNETVEKMLKMLQRLIGEGIQLSWNPETDLWLIKADPSQIDQILANLCVNARDAISGTGKITIKTGNSTFDEKYCAYHPFEISPGDYACLSISDDGCGMDKNVQAHIFEPFYTTKGCGSGTGLGLATVYGAVKQNNGFLTVYSELGLGTVFNIYLPRLDSIPQAVIETENKAIRHGIESILLVEDDEMLLRLQKLMLEESGYTVLAAATTDLAISLAREHPGPIQLMISDVVMPSMNGKQLSEKLRDLRPEMKTLFVSGYTADIISDNGVIEEGVHFLQKPFSIEALTAKVRDVLDSP
jgi:signal transduction histidine kinase/ActR/RegA family two-component response regulator